ncbi:hypothetical protein V1477_004319 [Vespula maculifrons]|uniref:Uncharacterized protein n=1 Tax=Vespula maculifrons TaxID=7453 RepID=A0ABD2CR85_VESMC
MRTTENSNIKAVSVVAVASLYSDHSLAVEASSFLTSHLTAAVAAVAAAASSLATAESAVVAPPLFRQYEGRNERRKEHSRTAFITSRDKLFPRIRLPVLRSKKKGEKTKKIRVEGDEEELKVQLSKIAFASSSSLFLPCSFFFTLDLDTKSYTRLRYKVANTGEEKVTFSIYKVRGLKVWTRIIDFISEQKFRMKT